jgi:HK97 gp10 family phage protein
MAGNIRGAREVENLLRQLPEKAAKRVTTNALKAGARVLVKGIKARARKRTGELARSPVVTSAAKVTDGRGLVSIGFRTPVSRRVHLTEFGTEHSPAQPFIRPTLDQDATVAVKAIGENIGKGVVREARRLAKK